MSYPISSKSKAILISYKKYCFLITFCNFSSELIDQVLEEDDTDHDGYLSYSEYVSGRRKEMRITFQ